MSTPKPKKWRVVGSMTISVHVDVEARTREEALEKAAEADVQPLCHQCADGEPGCWNTSGELDGTPEVGTATELKRR